MGIDWQRLGELIDRHARFAITTHVQPDGDAVGSELAMAELLKARGKTVAIINPTCLPDRYAFLNNGAPAVEAFSDDGAAARLDAADAILIVDTGAWDQLGDLVGVLRATSATKIVIDHHVKQSADLTEFVFADSEAPAVGTLILEAFDQLGVAVTPVAAEALFVAIAMDTGWFRFEKTTADTYRTAARLIDAGVSPFRMHLLLNNSSRPERLRLLARSLDHIRLAYDGRVVHSYLSRADFEETGATYEETEDLIQIVQSIKGVAVAVSLIEREPGRVKISLRSTGEVDCSALARQFGGGGHRAASGATIEGTIDGARQTILDAIGGVLGDPSATS